MLRAARAAPRLLGDSTPLVVDFLCSQMNADGGFKDRAGQSDLYYSVFGMESLMALDGQLPCGLIRDYLHGFANGANLDLVHLSCLARCWSNLPDTMHSAVPRDEILNRVESHRSADGGYSPARGAAHGTIYACFVAAGAYENFNAPMPNSAAMLDCLRAMRCEDGGYANQHDVALAMTPTTSAAAMLLEYLRQPPDPQVAPWLLARFCQQGGCMASVDAPMPDLLSTATALHALCALGVDLAPLREQTLDFIDSLWTSKGGFYGNWGDDQLDCEYTYYALLALGHLSP